MSSAPAPPALAQQARRVFVDSLVKGSATVPTVLTDALHQRLKERHPNPDKLRGLRDALAALQQHGASWQMGLISALRSAHRSALGPAGTTPGGGVSGGAPRGLAEMSLVGDETIEREIASSRLALALQGDAQWQFTDLRTRMQALERRGELSSDDLLRPQTSAKLWVEAWYGADLHVAEWQVLNDALEAEFAHWLGAAYHDANHWLLEQGVLPEVDLRPFIRRARGLQAMAEVGVSFVESTALRPHHGSDSLLPNSQSPAQQASQAVQVVQMAGAALGALIAAGSTRAPTLTAQELAAAGMLAQGALAEAQAEQLRLQSPTAARANDVLQQMQQVLQRQVPALARRVSLAQAEGSMHVVEGQRDAPLDAAGLVRISPRLQAVIARAQEALQRAPAGAPLEEARSRSQAFKQVLKQAAGSPEERATIELVAMMFQSILQDERLPASVRVWFARLQMPVLRVAVVEPDFFAADDHPTRRLIDRMGACVLGFDAAQPLGDVLEREIKRIVQVIEAYPDTGRRVFQTVLTEFESFLSHFFANDNPASSQGVSLAQKIEERETLAIQYTIELRRMLADMPVDDGLREFLFQVWADVLAVCAIRDGAQAEHTLLMKRAAADLIWSAGAKSSPEERAEVIRRLPQLLKTLRDGMAASALPQKKQDESIRRLNGVLATAFTAKAAPIPRDRLEELFERLQSLETQLPALDDLDLDEDLVRDLSGHERDGLEVVTDGGAVPSDAMLAWARELSVGGWYRLNFRGREDVLQLAWVGARQTLLLFVSPQGRAVLFPLRRLAAYLQAGLLQPAQEESLTVKATRDALAQLEQRPDALT